MTIITKDRGSYVQETEFELERFAKYFWDIVEDTGHSHNKEVLQEALNKTVEFVQGFPKVKADKLSEYIIRHVNDYISTSNPDIKWVVSSAFRRNLYKKVSITRGFDYKKGYGNLYQLIKLGVERGHYDESLINQFTEDEINSIGNMINPEMDKLIDNAGIELLADKYLQRNYNGKILELPQERFMIATMYLLKDEPKNKRLEYIEEAYEYISNQLIGLSTPTLMSSGRAQGSLSSCHVLTMGDDLVSIFDTNKDTARFSQAGAGLGIFMGFLRASGSWIRGHKGRSSGVTHPSRLMSVLAEYVNQLGSRNAGIALYLPVTHLDIFDFLELRLKTGTQEKRAHSIKTAVNLPDEFMRRVSNKENWTLFDPYEFEKIMGVNFNDLYDEEKLKDGETPNIKDHSFTYYYRLAEQTEGFELKKVVRAVDVYKAIYESRKTSGTPYLFFSDSANRLNPNKHTGIIYSSNLCNEIYMSMSADKTVSETIVDENGDKILITKKKIGDMTTCNLNSFNWGKGGTDKWLPKFEQIIKMQVRLLDNVISLNRAVVPQALATNDKYRAIGAGDMGLIEYLTNNGFQWESNETTEEINRIFKMKLKAVIKASYELALEKGSYPVFEGSSWNTGEFFDKRGFYGDEWIEYRDMASKAMRNSYTIAIAPTSSNAIINDTTPSLDPLYDVIYKEKKSGIEVLRIPSNFNNKTRWYYKSGFEMDEMWAIKHIAEAQKFVDQGISHNMQVNVGIKGSEMLRLDLGAWNNGLKGVYYTFTSTMEKPENCVNCEG